MGSDREMEMMKVLFSPQVSERVLKYEFKNDVVTATLNGVTDTFDFSGMPDGIADSIESEVFDFNPVLSAKKESNTLYLELINFIGTDATEEEKFPEWFEVKSDGKD